MSPSTLLLALLLPFGATLADDAAAASDERAAALSLSAPVPTLASLPAWREQLLPRGDELAFESIPWITRFDRAMVRADELQKPVFFWAMNGHPLGCT